MTEAAGVLSPARMRAMVDEWVRRLHVVTPDADLPVSSLSGGNQQRVMLARWLARSPRILLLNGPTVGVDVGSKADIHAIPELLAACDRILVMQSGRMTEDIPRAAAEENALAARLAG